MYRTTIACCVMLISLETSYAQERVRAVVSLNDDARIQELASKLDAEAVAEEANLARELIATKAADGVLVGLTKNGEAIIEASREALPELMMNRVVNNVTTDVPAEEDITPIDSLMVSYADNQKPTAEELQESGFEIVPRRKNAKGSFLLIKTADGQITTEQVTALQHNKKIKFAAINYKAKIDPSTKPNGGAMLSPAHSELALSAADLDISDPFFANGSLWGMQTINAPTMWRKLNVSEEVILAVVDTGIDYEHEDLANNIWQNPGETGTDASGRDRSTNGRDDDGNGFVDDVYGYDFIGETAKPRDRHSHGTHVAGTIAAMQNNVGVIGVNWKSKLMALKYLDDRGENGSDTNAIDAIDYAIANGAKVINFSTTAIGGQRPEFERAIERARMKGALVVAAAGNSEPDSLGENIDAGPPRYPASFPTDNVISVLAINRAAKLSDFSNFGPRSVDIGAPGGARNGPREEDTLSTVPDDLYDYKYGTSMATPHVSGAVALMLSMERYQSISDPVTRALAVKGDLLTNAHALGDLRGKCISGGYLDLAFLGEDGSPVVPNKVSAYARFGHYQKTASGLEPTLLATTRIRLDQPAEIHVRADTTVTCDINQRTKFIVAFSDRFPPAEWTQQSWAESQRVLTINGAGESDLVALTYATELPAGEHVIYWFVGDIKTGRNLAPGAKLTFGAGCMTVDAFDLPGE